MLGLIGYNFHIKKYQLWAEDQVMYMYTHTQASKTVFSSLMPYKTKAKISPDFHSPSPWPLPPFSVLSPTTHPAAAMVHTFSRLCMCSYHNLKNLSLCARFNTLEKKGF
jgi:hypothetical protein